MIRHASVADALESAELMNTRCCEYPNCTITASTAEMYRQIDGSWLCPGHHETYRALRTITVEVSPEDLVALLTCIEVADPCTDPPPPEITTTRRFYGRLFEAVRAAKGDAAAPKELVAILREIVAEGLDNYDGAPKEPGDGPWQATQVSMPLIRQAQEALAKIKEGGTP
jgi:hypothetical protein